MTVVDQACAIISEYTDKASQIIAALAKKRIGFVMVRASHDLFVRFHAHCRYLGEQTGYGYQSIYNDAIAYAMDRDEWPVKVIPITVEVGGEGVTVDTKIPESTTRATNKQLLCAYEYITETAAEHGISLPEAI